MRFENENGELSLYTEEPGVTVRRSGRGWNVHSDHDDYMWRTEVKYRITTPPGLSLSVSSVNGAVSVLRPGCAHGPLDREREDRRHRRAPGGEAQHRERRDPRHVRRAAEGRERGRPHRQRRHRAHAAREGRLPFRGAHDERRDPLVVRAPRGRRRRRGGARARRVESRARQDPRRARQDQGGDSRKSSTRPGRATRATTASSTCPS